jgi:hypothetical protein
MKRFILSLICLVALPYPALASNFCLAAAGLPPQCIYADPQSCERARTGPEQGCLVNPETSLRSSGGAPYCVVSADLVAQCIHYDRSACSAQATRSNAVCTERQSANDNNPYRYDQRLQN